MSMLTKTVGERLRGYRIQAGLSQEKVAERAGLHPTYIGQVERGEKNITIDSLDKVVKALNIPLHKLFENMSDEQNFISIPGKCYNLILGQTLAEQQKLWQILEAIIKYKETD